MVYFVMPFSLWVCQSGFSFSASILNRGAKPNGREDLFGSQLNPEIPFISSVLRINSWPLYVKLDTRQTYLYSTVDYFCTCSLSEPMMDFEFKGDTHSTCGELLLSVRTCTSRGVRLAKSINDTVSFRVERSINLIIQ
jgi:hypothetical protein